MQKQITSLILAFVLAAVLSSCARQASGQKGVMIIPKEDQQEVDVLMDGQPFTSYIFDSKYDVLKKPVLYPLRSPSGVVITRGYPLEPKAGERTDHPHHIGLWFNYGNVDGLDFWNNSSAIPAERAPHMGHIVHRAITETKSGEDSGVLGVSMDWNTHDNKTLMKEDARYVFHEGENSRAIDYIVTLTALDKTVQLHDNKEGVLGIRVTRALELPTKRPIKLTGPDGKPMEVPVLDNEGVTGDYLSSEGATGEDVWGTRGRWVELTGVVEGQPVTLAILDHPDNVGFPTYWHARPYGLFAANPLGQAVFSNGKKQLNYELPAGKSVTFRYRILILSGKATADQMEQEYQDWIHVTS